MMQAINVPYWSQNRDLPLASFYKTAAGAGGEAGSVGPGKL